MAPKLLSLKLLLLEPETGQAPKSKTAASTNILKRKHYS